MGLGEFEEGLERTEEELQGSIQSVKSLTKNSNDAVDVLKNAKKSAISGQEVLGEASNQLKEVVANMKSIGELTVTLKELINKLFLGMNGKQTNVKDNFGSSIGTGKAVIASKYQISGHYNCIVSKVYVYMILYQQACINNKVYCYMILYNRHVLIIKSIVTCYYITDMY